MRLIITILMCSLLPIPVFASDVPSLLCSVYQTKIIIFGEQLEEMPPHGEKTMYRLEANKLYVNDFEKSEYFYSNIQQVNDDVHRYSAAHKTIIFDSNFGSAYVTHVSGTDAQISKWICQKEKK